MARLSAGGLLALWGLRVTPKRKRQLAGVIGNARRTRKPILATAEAWLRSAPRFLNEPGGPERKLARKKRATKKSAPSRLTGIARQGERAATAWLKGGPRADARALEALAKAIGVPRESRVDLEDGWYLTSTYPLDEHASDEEFPAIALRFAEGISEFSIGWARKAGRPDIPRARYWHELSGETRFRQELMVIGSRTMDVRGARKGDWVPAYHTQHRHRELASALSQTRDWLAQVVAISDQSDEITYIEAIEITLRYYAGI